MITFTGQVVLPNNSGCPNELDIATGMCRITRYAGAIWCPLAAHSILVAELCYHHVGAQSSERALSLWARGLLHDAHETVTGEVVRAWKTKETRVLEGNLDERIALHFWFDPIDLHAPAIHACDIEALQYEAEYLRLPGWAEYYKRFCPGYKGPDPDGWPIARKILSSEWMNPANARAESEKIKILAKAFGFVRSRELDKARVTIQVSY